jgi:MFS family permease
MTTADPLAVDESSIRYVGWRIVAVCFLVATFGWGLGFYGQSVYLAELRRVHGWPASWISTATTVFYLTGALLVAFISDAMRVVGPRNCLIAGAVCLGLATTLLGWIDTLWQLYAVNMLLALGWAGTSLGAITNALGMWFDRRRGMAISLALNGASCGGIVGVPLLVTAIGHFGFSGAMLVTAATTVLLLVPVLLLFVGQPPRRDAVADAARSGADLSASRVRAAAFRDAAFLTLTTAFALVLFAQVGFIVHLISFLDPVLGREHAAMAVALLTAMAVAGRLLLSTVIDRLDQRLVSAVSFASQAIALGILILFRNEALIFLACAVFGFSVGNLITLPALIVQREFDPRAFGILVSLITAVSQIFYSFGPGVIGVLRDMSGSYTLPFCLCIALELCAAVLILMRRRPVG